MDYEARPFHCCGWMCSAPKLEDGNVYTKICKGKIDAVQ